MAHKAGRSAGTLTGLRWDDVLSTGAKNAFTSQLANHFLKRASPCTPQGAAVWEFLNSCVGDHRVSDLCHFDLDYFALQHEAPDTIYNCRQVLALYQKDPDLEIGVDRRVVSLESFLGAEQLCRETNGLFRAWKQGRFQFRPAVERVLHTAQRKISATLGDLPPLNLLKLRFGPGATTSRKKRFANPRYKLGDKLACSEDMIPLLTQLIPEIPSCIPPYEGVEGSVEVEIHPARLSFVRKSAKTDRGIVVEPLLNTFVQLGIGDYMSRRLRKIGVDIRDQTRNQRMAEYGSRTGALATLDLSAASDTVSTGLVEHLLPPEWFDFLSLCRSGTVSVDGVLLRQHKFSSMGNGFTFPLETLIFHCVSCAVCEVVGCSDYLVSTFGDDIIVPTQAATTLLEVLKDLGFVVSPTKSYWEGPFRESCGADYFYGVSVRPAYLRGGTMVADLFTLHNFFVRRGDKETASLIRTFINPMLWIWGPDGYGDGHLVDSDFGKYVYYKHMYPPKKHQQEAGYRGLLFDTFTFGKRRSFAVSDGDRILPAYSTYVKGNWPSEESDTPLSYLDGRGDSEFTYKTVNRENGCGEELLGVVLPGTNGYKRISIYIPG